MTPKVDNFVKHHKDFLTRVKKATKLKLVILLINPNFSLFDVNTQCLMRQEVQLLSEEFNFLFFIFYFFLFFFLSISC
jgi:hypothetical protein